MAKKIVLDKTAFVVHPVLPELKAKLNSEGFKIIDAQFAPEGEEIVGNDAPKAEKPKKGKKAETPKQNEGGSDENKGVPDGTQTPIPEEWEALTDDEMIALATALAGEPIVASGEQTPAQRAHSIIMATVSDRESRK